ncbi:MAG TPA: MarR family winged helix-turn-helix transcriptional regulator [Terriglobales bacterium]|nr:MarR family winged helix-turn-helix transcriptional regulator [Terriglobales bacterium]
MKSQSPASLSPLPCACANLRRATRAVTRMYNHTLRSDGLEITQFTILMALSQTGETTQGRLGKLLALDSTTLTRTLKLVKERGWVKAKPGDDRRQNLLMLTAAGRDQLQRATPHWKRAQEKLRTALGEATWSQLGELLAEVTRAGVEE